MKKILVFICLSLSLLSCNSSDEKDENPNDNIVSTEDVIVIPEDDGQPDY